MRYKWIKPEFILFLTLLFFFLLNIFWVVKDNTLPFIGDDARWLEETYNLTTDIQEGDLPGLFNRWENLFTSNTNSVPRTPLFTLVSIPTFLIFGPNTNAAIATNLVLLTAASVVIYYLVLELFKKDRRRYLFALLTVFLVNLSPGYFGMARLYMSEILQTLFVALITLLSLKWADSKSPLNYLFLGILLAAGVLLRFILPVYLIVPLGWFLLRQLQRRSSIKKWGIRILLFLIGFLPLALSWYGKNFFTYLEFTRYTSVGALAEVTTLGPVWSPLTWLRFWKVIALWHFGWPLISSIIMAVVAFLYGLKSKLKQPHKLLKTSPNRTTLILLALAPLPALVATTLSVNKTARYFLPVEFFWLILAAYITVVAIKRLQKHSSQVVRNAALALFSLLFVLLCYNFLQSLFAALPLLPGTGYLSASGRYKAADPDEAMYQFVLEGYLQQKDSYRDLQYYIIPEQQRFNDAQLQWYFTTKGESLISIGEFSPHTALKEGTEKVEAADILLIDLEPEIADLYMEKYEQLLQYLSADNSWRIVESRDFLNGAKLIILMRTPYLAEQ